MQNEFHAFSIVGFSLEENEAVIRIAFFGEPIDGSNQSRFIQRCEENPNRLSLNSIVQGFFDRELLC